MKKLKAWIDAARLRTLPLSVAGIIAGSAAAIGISKFNTLIFILALCTTLGLQILSNFANDYGDGVKGTDNEDRIGPKRAMQAGLLTAKELKSGMILTSIITFAFACLLIFVSFGVDKFFTSMVFLILGILSIAAAVKYTVGNSAYGYRAMGDLFVFLFFGLLSVMGSYYLYSLSLKEWIILPAFAVGLLSVAVLNMNNMRDQESDKKSNKITIPVLLGYEMSKHYHFALITFAGLTALVYAILLWNVTGIYGLIPLLAFIPLAKNAFVVRKNTEPVLLDPELKKIALSTFFYSLLVFVSFLLA